MQYKCPKCGNIIQEGTKFCDKCGQQFNWPSLVSPAPISTITNINQPSSLKSLICQRCNSNSFLKEGDYFICQNCGTKILSEEAREITGTVKIDNSDLNSTRLKALEEAKFVKKTINDSYSLLTKAQETEKQTKNNSIGCGSFFIFVVSATVIFFVLSFINGLIENVAPSAGNILTTISSIVSLVLAAILSYFAFKKLKEMKSMSESEYKRMYKEANDLIENNRDRLNVIPERYWSKDPLDYIVEMLETNRADTIREALELTDTQIHRWKLEAGNAAQIELLKYQAQKLNSIEGATWMINAMSIYR